jgi:hypothetical protein
MEETPAHRASVEPPRAGGTFARDELGRETRIPEPGEAEVEAERSAAEAKAARKAVRDRAAADEAKAV